MEVCNKLGILKEQSFTKSEPVITEIHAEQIPKLPYAVIAKVYQVTQEDCNKCGEASWKIVELNHTLEKMM